MHNKLRHSVGIMNGQVFSVLECETRSRRLVTVSLPRHGTVALCSHQLLTSHTTSHFPPFSPFCTKNWKYYRIWLYTHTHTVHAKYCKHFLFVCFIFFEAVRPFFFIVFLLWNSMKEQLYKQQRTKLIAGVIAWGCFWKTEKVWQRVIFVLFWHHPPEMLLCH